MGKKRILFYNKDKGGVDYYRIVTPAIELERIDTENYFQVEVVNDLNFNKKDTLEYLKSFDIIQYHKYFSMNDILNHNIISELKNANVKLVVDIDDYWDLDKNHPLYVKAKTSNDKKRILANLNMADYITTTTEIFSNEIIKTIKKNNIYVFENGINPNWMKQFEDNRYEDPNGLVRITYMGGSSHLHDLKQLNGVVNILRSDNELKNKFKVILAGWDSKGTVVKSVLNEKLKNELIERGLWSKFLINEFNKHTGDISKIKTLPMDIKNKYKNSAFIEKTRDITTSESVYCDYEKILTDNYRLIDDKKYQNWLLKFEIGGVYHNEGSYGRRWSKPSNIYANVLNETDIVLAPLEGNKFNMFKSELKQTECWSRRLPIVCSDVIPYNVHGEHMKNCVLIPNKKNNIKHWAKNLKKLILNKELRDNLGEKLYNDFNKNFNLTTITKRRMDFYRKILNENND